METYVVFAVVLALFGVCGSFYLIIKASDVLNEHKEAIEKNKSAVQLLANRLDDVASMVALCPDDLNTQDFFEEGEINEQ